MQDEWFNFFAIQRGVQLLAPYLLMFAIEAAISSILVLGLLFLWALTALVIVAIDSIGVTFIYKIRYGNKLYMASFQNNQSSTLLSKVIKSLLIP